MMDDKKIMNSKVWIFFDWVWRLMVLNVLVLITSIGVITIVPAICAAFKSIKDTKENYTPNIFKNYFINFRYLFRDTFAFSIILIILSYGLNLGLFPPKINMYGNLVRDFSKTGKKQ